MTAGCYWKGKLTALSEQEREHVMNLDKSIKKPISLSNGSERTQQYNNFSSLVPASKKKEEVIKSSAMEKEFPPERGTERVTLNPARSLDKSVEKSLFPSAKVYHFEIEKSKRQFVKQQGTQKDNYDDLIKKEEVIESLEKPPARARGKRESNKPRIFSDEHARFAWELSQAVNRVVAALPPEDDDRDPKFQRITFRPKHRNKGIHAIFYTGTVIPTGKENVLIVPERTLKVLDAIGIQYGVVQDK